jgi:hypothetical protein
MQNERPDPVRADVVPDQLFQRDLHIYIFKQGAEEFVYFPSSRQTFSNVKNLLT